MSTEPTPALNPAWHWVREDAGHWSLLPAPPGYLRITTQAGDLYAGWNNNRNMLLQPAPPGDFEISARMVFNPSQEWHNAGIVVMQNDDNYFAAERWFAGGSYVGLGYEVAGGAPTGNHVATTLTTVFLKIAKTGSTYTAFYSTNGSDWTQMDQKSGVTFSALQIGLYAYNGAGSTASEIPADFDWFCIKR
jgi:ammonium transporter Rh